MQYIYQEEEGRGGGIGCSIVLDCLEGHLKLVGVSGGVHMWVESGSRGRGMGGGGGRGGG